MGTNKREELVQALIGSSNSLWVLLGQAIRDGNLQWVESPSPPASEPPEERDCHTCYWCDETDLGACAHPVVHIIRGYGVHQCLGTQDEPRAHALWAPRPPYSPRKAAQEHDAGGGSGPKRRVTFDELADALKPPSDADALAEEIEAASKRWADSQRYSRFVATAKECEDWALRVRALEAARASAVAKRLELGEALSSAMETAETAVKAADEWKARAEAAEARVAAWEAWQTSWSEPPMQVCGALHARALQIEGEWPEYAIGLKRTADAIAAGPPEEDGDE